MRLMIGHCDANPVALPRCRPSAPPLIYDQDLPSDVARQERWLAMARQAADALNLLLPEAINLVHRVVPTMRMGVEPPRWYEPNEVFNRALLEDRDILVDSRQSSWAPSRPPRF